MSESAEPSRSIEEQLAAARERVAADAGDVDALEDLWSALDDRARVFGEAGRHVERAEVLREVVDVVRRVVGTSQDTELRWDLATALWELAETYACCEDDERAVAAFEEDAAIDRELVAARPDDASYWNSLSLALAGLRDAYVRLGRTPEALAAARELIPSARRHAELEPSRRRDLGVDFDELGELLAETGDCDGAESAYTEAESVFRSLVAADASCLSARDDLAICIGCRSRVLLAAGDAAGALARSDEALAMHRALVRDDPTGPRRRLNVGNELRHRTEVHTALGDIVSAAASADEALATFRGCRGVIGRGDDLLRSALEEAAEAASAAGRPDRAAELRAELGP